jgi:hypothetical protein
VKLLLNGINGRYLRDIIEDAAPKTERVDAAVAYATEASLLFEWCWEKRLPLRFWGRFDETIPVSIPILKWFLDRRSANLRCKLLRHLHAKVIWWRGYGAYIGSANLTQTAWYNGVEAGFFLSEARIIAGGHDLELEQFFSTIDSKASPLTKELYDIIERRARRLGEADARDQNETRSFLATPHVQPWEGLVHFSRKRAIEKRKVDFLREWNSTLQIIRDLGAVVSQDGNRPAWVRSGAPLGAQADQFLHAHYYQRTFENRVARYEEHFERNRKNPDDAVQDAISWWRKLKSPPSSEDVMLNDWAPLLRENLSGQRLPYLSEQDFVDIFWRVHAIREYARRVANKAVGLPADRKYSIHEKVVALARRVYRSRSVGSALNTLSYVLYGGRTEDVPQRLWDAVTEPHLRIQHLGISALGELVGWAMPDNFPPRNGRTSKALRSLGYDVTVHVS